MAPCNNKECAMARQPCNDDDTVKSLQLCSSASETASNLQHMAFECDHYRRQGQPQTAPAQRLEHMQPKQRVLTFRREIVKLVVLHMREKSELGPDHYSQELATTAASGAHAGLEGAMLQGRAFSRESCEPLTEVTRCVEEYQQQRLVQSLSQFKSSGKGDGVKFDIGFCHWRFRGGGLVASSHDGIWMLSAVL